MFRILIVGALLLGLPGAAHGAPPTFSAHVTNRWFPLHPGSRYVYTGEKDGQASRDVVTVTPRVQTIRGAACAGVDDRLFVRGKLAERTTDWYTQDANGNVWYYGESTAELDRNGRVTSTEGSWRAGVRGARPGIFMPAQPRRGEAFRQEFYKGHAEDHFMVLSVLGDNAVLTKEWTPLEPGVLDHKLYVRGVGTVFEQTERGGSERNELVSFTGS
ncbi:MAG: hypothetical protein ACJ77E_01830 [Gaiellaceae bacterium]